MNILNEKIEIIAEVRLGTGLLKYCHIRYKDDGGGRYPVIIIEKVGALSRTTEAYFVIEKDFKEFVKNIYLRLDEIEVAENENKLLKMKDGIFSTNGKKTHL